MKFEYAEGATPIDESESEGLIPNHINLQSELNEWEQRNINKALIELLYKKFKFDKILDVEFILGIHKKMFDETWIWAGKIRNTEKNIGVPPEKIRDEFKKLLDDILFQIENKSYSNDEICVRFHHRLVKIHLFPNGNGRHSRVITDMLLKSLGESEFTWGGKNLSINNPIRKEYIDALNKADNGDYIPLMNFVRK
ncbi:MAG: mobile mystery protein B [Ignavibacteria bacterium]|nr:mobile mystery protein B [Ignavibacteria bacterium]HCN38171.1 mobile mystery protein B [Bacteroidota bacterium]